MGSQVGWNLLERAVLFLFFQAVVSLTQTASPSSSQDSTSQKIRVRIAATYNMH